MAHRRTEIRNAVAALLDTAPGMAGRIHKSRYVPVPAHLLPCYLVYATDEQSGHENLSRHMARVVNVKIEIIAAAEANHDDVVDAHALEIETLLGANPSLGGLARNVELTGSMIGARPDGEVIHAVGTLTYAVTYRTRGDNPALEN